MKPPIYVIHDQRRADRAKLLHQELEAQGLHVDDIHMMPAVYRENPADGIAEAHKACIRHCMGTNEPFAIIMEDDVQFTCGGAFRYFLDTAMQAPTGDLFMGGCYTVRNMRQVADNVVRLDGFSSTHLYIVYRSFFQRLLEAEPGVHLDQWLSKSGAVIHACYPFAARQYNGFSDNVKKEVNYDHLIKGFKFYTGIHPPGGYLPG